MLCDLLDANCSVKKLELSHVVVWLGRLLYYTLPVIKDIQCGQKEQKELKKSVAMLCNLLQLSYKTLTESGKYFPPFGSGFVVSYRTVNEISFMATKNIGLNNVGEFAETYTYVDITNADSWKAFKNEFDEYILVKEQPEVLNSDLQVDVSSSVLGLQPQPSTTPISNSTGVLVLPRFSPNGSPGVCGGRGT